jgi:hypothetical protein
MLFLAPPEVLVEGGLVEHRTLFEGLAKVTELRGHMHGLDHAPRIHNAEIRVLLSRLGAVREGVGRSTRASHVRVWSS